MDLAKALEVLGGIQADNFNEFEGGSSSPSPSSSPSQTVQQQQVQQVPSSTKISACRVITEQICALSVRYYTFTSNFL
jgi:hypothetical protein